MLSDKEVHFLLRSLLIFGSYVVVVIGRVRKLEVLFLIQFRKVTRKTRSWTPIMITKLSLLSPPPIPRLPLMTRGLLQICEFPWSFLVPRNTLPNSRTHVSPMRQRRQATQSTNTETFGKSEALRVRHCLIIPLKKRIWKFGNQVEVAESHHKSDPLSELCPTQPQPHLDGWTGEQMKRRSRLKTREKQNEKKQTGLTIFRKRIDARRAFTAKGRG